jgi:hypothetical protein
LKAVELVLKLVLKTQGDREVKSQRHHLLHHKQMLDVILEAKLAELNVTLVELNVVLALEMNVVLEVKLVELKVVLVELEVVLVELEVVLALEMNVVLEVKLVELEVVLALEMNFFLKV